MRNYFVYILTNRPRGVSYTGVTSNLPRRLYEHRTGAAENSFSQKYNLHRLVHVEMAGNPLAAIEREKQIKGWRRSKKITLIEESNPEWRDLSEDW